MPPVTVRSLSESLDLHEIERAARVKWQTDQRKRRRIEETILRALPFGLILMILIFFGLSSGHTADMLKRMSPDIVIPVLNVRFNMGDVSPAGWELGILIMAALIAAGWRSRLTYGTLYAMLVLNCIVNVAGALIAVIERGSGAEGVVLSQLTFQALFGMLGSLPAIDQITFIIAGPVGVFIPVLAKIAGEGLVKLALGQIKLTTLSDDERWAIDSERVMYAALFSAALAVGAGPKTAGNWAESMSTQFYRVKAAPTRELPAHVPAQGKPAPNALDKPLTGFAALLGQNGTSPNVPTPSHSPMLESSGLVQIDNGTSPNVPTLSQTEVIAWLNATPTAERLSNRDACRAYMQAVYNLDTDAGYKTFERARRAMRG